MVCIFFLKFLRVSNIFPAAGSNYSRMPPPAVKRLRLLKSRTMKLWTHGKLLVYFTPTLLYPVLNDLFVQGPNASDGSADYQNSRRLRRGKVKNGNTTSSLPIELYISHIRT